MMIITPSTPESRQTNLLCWLLGEVGMRPREGADRPEAAPSHARSTVVPYSLALLHIVYRSSRSSMISSTSSCGEFEINYLTLLFICFNTKWSHVRDDSVDDKKRRTRRATGGPHFVHQSMTREVEGAGGTVQLRALDFVELGQLSLNFLVRIQSGGSLEGRFVHH